MKKKLFIYFSLFLAVFLLSAKAPDEGMYPIMNINKIDLVKAGLKIDPTEIYNPGKTSLIDALVHIGGCTGSFVSEQGLIITNHHCAFGAINAASTPEQNYLENGFVAHTKEKEIPARGYTVRIMEAYEDVSDKILISVKDIKDLSERSKAISTKMNELAKAANDPENSIEARVSEMFIGQTYILFKYRVVKDVRLVYAPPRSIGEFGGESDNWVWPRHTGDFTFMRAYVSPDGKAVGYAKENVPFKPKKWLKINPNGVNENDFVFILGYPGRTFRHMPSQFIQYQEDYLLPYVADLHEWMIKQMEDIAGKNDALKLKYASTIKSLANTMKNYQGKSLGLRRLNLVEKKQDEEKLLNQFIQSTPELKNKYGNLLKEIDVVYKRMMVQAEADLWFSRFMRFSNIMRVVNNFVAYSTELDKPEKDRKDMINKKRAAKNAIESIDYEMEKRLLIKMLYDGKELDSNIKVEAINQFISDISTEEFVKEIFSNELLNLEKFEETIEQNTKQLSKNSLVSFHRMLSKQYDKITAENQQIDGTISKLMPQLTEVKMLWKKTDFIPDANSTLRLTYGYIKGYTPKDAVYYNPITTLDGVIEKSYLGDDYQIPDVLYNLYNKKDYGKFTDKKTGKLPVAILYNMDTTGGNSGSPILDANGDIIGVNFDRAYEATINDYAWNESYSRSIGVDIRYVLWVTQKIGGANHLLTEMGVKL